jgi:AcrR family transcriptional regulator
MSEQTRTRRSTQQVRELILHAATDEFAANGFSNTTTRAIAAAAGISLSTLHNQFPAKEQLFSAALLQPFLDAFDEFESAWPGQFDHAWDDPARMREFISGLYRHLKHHRATVVNLFAITDRPDSPIIADIRILVNETRTRLRTNEINQLQGSSVDQQLVTHARRMIVALVTGLILLEPFFSADDPNEDLVIIELATHAALRTLNPTP